MLVAALVLLNVLLGARQELKARASVDALSKLQVPQTRVLREGQLEMVPAEEVVPATSSGSRPATSCPPTAGSPPRPPWRRRRRR